MTGRGLSVGLSVSGRKIWQRCLRVSWIRLSGRDEDVFYVSVE